MTDDTKHNQQKPGDNHNLLSSMLAANSASSLTSVEVLGGPKAGAAKPALSMEAIAKATQNLQGDRGMVFGLAKSVSGFTAGMVTSTTEMALNPHETAKGLQHLGTTLVNNPTGMVKHAVSSYVDAFKNGNSETRGEMLGTAALTVGFLGMGARGMFGGGGGALEARGISTAAKAETEAMNVARLGATETRAANGMLGAVERETVARTAMLNSARTEGAVVTAANHTTMSATDRMLANANETLAASVARDGQAVAHPNLLTEIGKGEPAALRVKPVGEPAVTDLHLSGDLHVNGTGFKPPVVEGVNTGKLPEMHFEAPPRGLQTGPTIITEARPIEGALAHDSRALIGDGKAVIGEGRATGLGDGRLNFSPSEPIVDLKGGTSGTIHINEGGPVIHSGEPVHLNGEPIRGTGEPIRGTSEPIRGTGEPIRGTSEPIRANGEPIRGTSEPIRANGESVPGNREPIQLNRDPVHLNSEPGSSLRVEPNGNGRPNLETNGNVNVAPAETTGNLRINSEPTLKIGNEPVLRERLALPEGQTRINLEEPRFESVRNSLQTTERDLTQQLDAIKVHANNPEINAHVEQVQTSLRDFTKNPSEASFKQLDKTLNDLQAATGGDAQLSKAVQDLRINSTERISVAVDVPVTSGNASAVVDSNVAALKQKLPAQTQELDAVAQDFRRVADNPSTENLTNLRQTVQRLEESVPATQRAAVSEEIATLRQNSIGSATELNSKAVTEVGGQSVERGASTVRVNGETNVVRERVSLSDAQTKIEQPNFAEVRNSLEATQRDVTTQLDNLKLHSSNPELNTRIEEVKTSLRDFAQQPSEASFKQLDKTMNELQAAARGDEALSRAVSDIRTNSIERINTVVETPITGGNATAVVDTNVAVLKERLPGQTTQLDQVAQDFRRVVENPSTENVANLRRTINELEQTVPATERAAVAEQMNTMRQNALGNATELNVSRATTEATAARTEAISKIEAIEQRTGTTKFAEDFRNASDRVVNANSEAAFHEASQQLDQKLNAWTRSLEQDLRAGKITTQEMQDIREATRSFVREQEQVAVSNLSKEPGLVYNNAEPINVNRTVDRVETNRVRDLSLENAQRDINTQLDGIKNRTTNVEVNTKIEDVRTNLREFANNPTETSYRQFERSLNELQASTQGDAALNRSVTELRTTVSERINPTVVTASDTAVAKVETQISNLRERLPNQTTELDRVSQDFRRAVDNPSGENVQALKQSINEFERSVPASERAAVSEQINAVRNDAISASSESRVVPRNEGGVSAKVEPQVEPQTVNRGAKVEPQVEPQTVNRGSRVEPQVEPQTISRGTDRVTEPTINRAPNASTLDRSNEPTISRSTNPSNIERPIEPSGTGTTNGGSVISRTEQITGRTTEQVFDRDVAKLETQTGTDAARMFQANDSTSFRQAVSQFQESSAAYNKAITEGASGANLTPRQIEQLSVDSKATVNAAREQFLNNAWQNAIDSRARLVNAADDMVSTAKLPAGLQVQANNHVQLIETAAQRYAAAETTIGQQTAARQLQNQVQQFESYMNSVAPGSIQPGKLNAGVADFMKAADMREARFVASMTDGIGAPVKELLYANPHVYKAADFIWNNPTMLKLYMGIAAYDAVFGTGALTKAAINESYKVNPEQPARRAAETPSPSSEAGVRAASVNNPTTAGQNVAAGAQQQSPLGTAQPGSIKDAANNVSAQPVGNANVQPLSSTGNATRPEEVQRISSPGQQELNLVKTSLSMAFFGAPITAEGRRALNRQVYGVDSEYIYRGPGAQPISDAEARPLSLPAQNNGFRAEPIEQQERPTNRTFDWRKTQLDLNQLGRREGFYMSANYATGDAKTRHGKGGASKQDEQNQTHGLVSQHFNFLTTPRDAARRVTASKDPIAESSEAKNPDQGSTSNQDPTTAAIDPNQLQTNNDPRMQTAANSNVDENEPITLTSV